MTCNVLGGTLNLTQLINKPLPKLLHETVLFVIQLFLLDFAAHLPVSLVV